MTPLLIILWTLSFISKSEEYKGSLEVHLLVPKQVRAGSHVTLVCQYNLKGSQLYSIKWYRGSYEFYRFLPGVQPPQPAALAFSRPGLQVDLSGSNSHQVTLKNVGRALSGKFTCEVSAEGPTFKTASDSSHLDVIERSVKKPVLAISTSVFKFGSNISINCTVEDSRPAPEVAFYINDEKVDQDWVRQVNGTIFTLMPAALNAEILAARDRGVGMNSPLWVRCEATVLETYRATSTSIPLMTFLYSPAYPDLRSTQPPAGCASRFPVSLPFIFFTFLSFLTIT